MSPENTRPKEGTHPPSQTGRKKISLTPSTALLTQKLGLSPAPRMLTASEIALLQASKREMNQQVGEALEKSDEALAGEDDAS